jgi:WD40 repeat protein
MQTESDDASQSVHRHDIGRWSQDFVPSLPDKQEYTKEIEMVDFHQSEKQRNQQVVKRFKNESCIPLSRKFLESLRSTSDSSFIEQTANSLRISSRILLRRSKHVNLSKTVMQDQSISFLSVEGSRYSPDFVVNKVIKTHPETPSEVFSVIYDSTGKNIITAGADGCIRFFNESFEEWHCIFSREGQVIDISISHDDTYLASSHSSGKILIWHIASKTVFRRYPGFKGKLYSVKYLHTQNKVAFCYSRTIWVSDLEVQNNDMAIYCNSICFCISISSEDTILISGHNDGKVRIWDMSSNELNLEETLHDGAIIACKISPSDDYLATASRDNTIVIFDLRYCTVINKIRDLSYMTVNNFPKICWSYDEKFIFSGGEVRSKNRGGVFVWDTMEFKLANTLLNEAGKAIVIACEWNPCRFEMVTGDAEGNIVIWN